MLAQLQLRAAWVDADPEYLYGVSRLMVFGSYLSDKPKLGDIDIAVQLGPKCRDPKEHWALCDQERQRAPAHWPARL